MDTKAILLFVSGIAVAAKVVWELYLSPLARQRIPGPKRAAISDVWQYLLQLRGIRVTTFHDVFEVRTCALILQERLTDLPQRYGPVVRIGPNTVAFRNIETIKTIYSSHRFRKSSWYNVFTVGGSHTMFTHLYGGFFIRCLIVLNVRCAGILPLIHVHAVSVHQRSEERISAQEDLCSFKKWKNLSDASVTTPPAAATSMSFSCSPD